MRLPVALLLVLTLALASCGGDDDEGSGSSTADRDTPTTATDTTDRTTTDRAQRDGDGKDETVPRDEPESTAPAEPEPARRAPESPQAKPIRATLNRFFDGMGAKDGKKVCGTFSRQLKDLVGSALGTDCPGGMAYAFNLIIPKGLDESFRQVRVRRVTVKGNRARAKLRLPKKIREIPTLQFVAKNSSVSLRRQGGGWKLDLPPV